MSSVDLTACRGACAVDFAVAFLGDLLAGAFRAGDCFVVFFVAAFFAARVLGTGGSSGVECWASHSSMISHVWCGRHGR